MGRLVTEGEWNEAHFSLTPDGEHDLITCGVLGDFLSHIIRGIDISLSDSSEDVPGLESCLFGWRPLNHVEDENTFFVGQA